MTQKLLGKHGSEEFLRSESDEEQVKPRKRRNMSSSSSEDERDYFTHGSIDEDSEYDTLEDVTSNSNIKEELNSTKSGEWMCEKIHRLNFAFLAQPGINFDRSAKKKCMFYVEKYFDDDLIRMIVAETNKNAENFFEKDISLKPRSRAWDWTATNENEMKIFIALLILQGIVKKSSFGLYFSRRECIETPFFYKVMSEKRFTLILKFIHFANKHILKTEDGNRKICKLDPVLSQLKKSFKELYKPEMEITMDERRRCGMKLYMLCECTTGYVWNFLIDIGQDAEYPHEAYTNKIILELSHDLLNQGYRLYLDNRFTSIPLAEKLCDNNTEVIGILRKNRKDIPRDLVSKILDKDECIARYREKIMVMRWNDGRELLLLSTVHDDKMVTVKKHGNARQRPQAVIDFNKNVRRVDICDEIIRKRVKNYYFNMLLLMIELVSLNAFVLYKKDGGKLKKVDFLMEVVESYVETYSGKIQPSCSNPGWPHLKPQPTRLIERHFPDYISSESSRTNVTRRCKLCYANGLRRETRFWCPDCKTTLCMPKCFREYHTKD